MEYFLPFLILPAAFALDLLVGDPPGFPHPVRLMGKAIVFAEPRFRALKLKLSLSGALFAVTLIMLTWGFTFILILIAGLISANLKTVLEIIIIYYSISSKALNDAAMDVYISLKQNRLNKAKRKVSYIVGRDTAHLSEQETARAAVETVAENFVDGVVSPLFFAILGGAPLAMAYKMVNTLDSMTGYKNEKYIDFGKAAAKIDDFFNFIPARISVFFISLSAHFLAGKGFVSLKAALRDGRKHSSPNAGFPEAAFAGALAVRLGGPGKYFGKIVNKPYIGQNFPDIRVDHIPRACELMMLASLTGIFTFCILNITTVCFYNLAGINELF